MRIITALMALRYYVSIYLNFTLCNYVKISIMDLIACVLCALFKHHQAI